jgi:hypothetical protein
MTPEIADVAQIIETDKSSYSSFHENLSAHNKKIAEDTLEKLIELNSRLTARIQRQQVNLVKKKRNVYTLPQRKSLISYFHQLDGNIASKIERIQQISGYEKISHQSILRWGKSKNTRGRQVCPDFEKQVAAELMIVNLNASNEHHRRQSLMESMA